jgi:hypothetical protein
MKKLEDIPKKQVFNVPDGYFEHLSSTIQARVAERDSRRATAFFTLPVVVRYALPALVLAAIGVFWFQNNPSQKDAESILASVSTEDLVAYLNDSEISTEELVNAADFDADDLDDIESEVYQLHFDDLNLDDMQLDERDPEI